MFHFRKNTTCGLNCTSISFLQNNKQTNKPAQHQAKYCSRIYYDAHLSALSLPKLLTETFLRNGTVTTTQFPYTQNYGFFLKMFMSKYCVALNQIITLGRFSEFLIPLLRQPRTGMGIRLLCKDEKKK